VLNAAHRNGARRGEVAEVGDVVAEDDDAGSTCQTTHKSSEHDVSFNAYDADVLELLGWIADQLPFRATRKVAVDNVLLEMIQLLMVTEGSFSGVQKRLKELLHIQFYRCDHASCMGTHMIVHLQCIASMVVAST
jgi:hypothetical protein